MNICPLTTPGTALSETWGSVSGDVLSIDGETLSNDAVQDIEDAPQRCANGQTAAIAALRGRDGDATGWPNPVGTGS